MRSVLTLCLAISCVARPADGIAQQHGLCWRGRPLATCRSFVVTEFGVANLINLSDGPDFFSRGYFVWQLGAMVNLSQVFALGPVFLASTDDDYLWLGLRGRLRSRVSSHIYFDLSVGPYLNDSGYSVELALGFDDWIALSHTRERLRGIWVGHTGVKLGSWPGTVVGLLLPIVWGSVVYAAFN
jgi:hypothetical protein